MINHKERIHDLEGREELRKLCSGVILDLGSADRPICEEAITVDSCKVYLPKIVADVSMLPLSDEYADTIIASHILEHLDNTIDVLNEWKRVLKTNGKIGIMVPHGEYVDEINLGDSSMTHRQLFTEKTLELFLKHVGFREVIVTRIERPPAYLECPAIIATAIK